RNPKFWRAVLGLHHLYHHQYYTRERQVKAIIIHSHFKKETYENDIALFKLQKPITFNDYIQPICLLPSPLFLSNDTPCYITGWGSAHEKGRQWRTIDVLYPRCHTILSGRNNQFWPWLWPTTKSRDLCTSS
uniref:Peptidase S1 domain-containing protein n=1 Tax=Laticauda laticaudata TaxID=8630 RepID=A0A8C5SBK0_LATLA